MSSIYTDPTAMPKENAVTTVATDEKMRIKMQSKRKLLNTVALTLSLAAMAFGLFWLIWILYTTVTLGISGLSAQLFTEMTPPPNAEGGGLANAIMGTLLMVGFATLFATPLGILAGVHLAESRKDNKLAISVRFFNDILLSAPSIVIGLFVYAVMVRPMGHFSAWAGVVALGLIQIPIVIRTTENMLRLVPDALREAAFALGTPKWKMVMAITVKASYAGILTGILLGVARIAGETAPLLFTALSNQFWNSDMMKPMANLPVIIFNFALSPFTNWQELAWAGVFLITAGVLVLNIIARSLLKNSK